MTDWEEILVECFDVPPRQLPPVHLHKGMYMLEVEYRGRSFSFGHRHLTEVLKQYVKWLRKVNEEFQSELLVDRLNVVNK